MADHAQDWGAYVPVAERRRKAARELAQLRRKGHPVTPVTITGRRIATTFWGQAWCDTMESYGDFATRLPRGRTYVRNGSVVDLQISPATITALVSGSDLYRVRVDITEVPKARWQAMCADCAGAIGSLVDLLQGRLSASVMARLCRREDGLFPRSSEIRFTCSCLDHALMCKHVAAVLYGVGARLDHAPELLFCLRAVDGADLVGDLDATRLLAQGDPPAARRLLPPEDVARLFDLDLAEPALPSQLIAEPGKAKGKRPTGPARARRSPGADRG